MYFCVLLRIFPRYLAGVLAIKVSFFCFVLENNILVYFISRLLSTNYLIALVTCSQFAKKKLNSKKVIVRWNSELVLLIEHYTVNWCKYIV